MGGAPLLDDDDLVFRCPFGASDVASVSGVTVLNHVGRMLWCRSNGTKTGTRLPRKSGQAYRAVLQSPWYAYPCPRTTMDDDLTFGDWLQRRRKALHLTQQQLGQLARCATDTIRK